MMTALLVLVLLNLLLTAFLIAVTVFPAASPEPEAPRIHNAAVEATAEAVQEFAVTGRGGKLPFRFRKHEMREAGRSQRRKLEEWRD